MVLFDYIFYNQYWITRYVFRNKDYPLFSTIAIVTIIHFFTIISIYDFYVFQILKRRDIFADPLGYIILTIIFGFNFYYYKKNAYRILNKVQQTKQPYKGIYITIASVYILSVIVFTYYSATLIHDNIFIFEKTYYFKK